MRRLLIMVLANFFVLAIAGTLSVAQDFKQYPGFRFDDKASQQASAVEKQWKSGFTHLLTSI